VRICHLNTTCYVGAPKAHSTASKEFSRHRLENLPVVIFQTVSEKSAATDQPIQSHGPMIRSRGNSAIWGNVFDHGKVAVAAGERRGILPNDATGMDAILNKESRVLNSAIKWPAGLKRRED
jgi:hypothetical protein